MDHQSGPFVWFPLVYAAKSEVSHAGGGATYARGGRNKYSINKGFLCLLTKKLNIQGEKMLRWRDQTRRNKLNLYFVFVYF